TREPTRPSSAGWPMERAWGSWRSMRFRNTTRLAAIACFALASANVLAGVLTDVKAVASGLIHTCALTNAGAVFCWGAWHLGYYGYVAVPVAVPGVTSGVTSIASGIYHSCAVTASGGAKCWGSNYTGQLGDGTKNERREAATVHRCEMRV